MENRISNGTPLQDEQQSRRDMLLNLVEDYAMAKSTNREGLIFPAVQKCGQYVQSHVLLTESEYNDMSERIKDQLSKIRELQDEVAELTEPEPTE